MKKLKLPPPLQLLARNAIDGLPDTIPDLDDLDAFYIFNDKMAKIELPQLPMALD